MSIVGQILHTGIKYAPKKPLIKLTSKQKQIRVLQRLLKYAKHTAFGRRYDFNDMAKLKDPRDEFKKWMPVYQYDQMHAEWWHRSRQDEPDVTWPGIIPYYGVSSGSTQAASKFIPVTHESLNGWNKTAQKIFSSLSRYPEITPSLLSKQALMVGGSSKLIKEGLHFYGDNSGIMAKNRPYWLNSFYQPGHAIQDMLQWEDRVDAIVKHAAQWDIGFLVGNVAWAQLILEKILQHYKLDHIHQIWPNLTVLMHSGIFFEPYQESFEKTLGHPLLYLDTYAATEAFMAYQNEKNERGMKLVLNQGIYYEFIPYSDQYFDDSGKLKSKFPDTINIEDVEENTPYALLVSTTSGAWHYMIGDVISFSDKTNNKIKVLGRTKQCLNLTGEHLSEDNIHACIKYVNQKLGIQIKEYSVMGEKSATHFAHRWYLGSDRTDQLDQVRQTIDQYLKETNDDYAVQRTALLNKISVEFIPGHWFYEWLASRGKMNGQSKVPRVIHDDIKESWLQFVDTKKDILIY